MSLLPVGEKKLWDKIRDWFKKIWEKILLVDWSTFLTAIYKAVKPEDRKVDPKYIVVKPHILSDASVLRGVSVLRAVLTLIPATSLAAPILSLGEIGFNIFKHVALKEELSQLKFTPIDPNIVRFTLQNDLELKKHYGPLADPLNSDPSAVHKMEMIYNDFSFMTNAELLQAKYPEVSMEYIEERCSRNRELLQESLAVIEQEILKVSQRPEIQHNIQGALDALKTLFPAMRDWALFNSATFNQLIYLIDIAV